MAYSMIWQRRKQVYAVARNHYNIRTTPMQLPDYTVPPLHPYHPPRIWSLSTLYRQPWIIYLSWTADADYKPRYEVEWKNGTKINKTEGYPSLRVNNRAIWRYCEIALKEDLWFIPMVKLFVISTTRARHSDFERISWWSYSCRSADYSWCG